MTSRHVYNEHLIWTRFVCLILGVWLALTPWTFTYHSHLMVRNDIIVGILLVLCSLCSFKPERLWAPWAVCILGVWLQMAPLFFWAPDAFTYLNDTVVGALAITFSILVPGTPGERVHTGAETPPAGPTTPPPGTSAFRSSSLVLLAGSCRAIWPPTRWAIQTVSTTLSLALRARCW